ncbi:hypothetical protein MKX72_19940 [Priestia sp. FSL R5-0597]|uniref:hypothetical protein n=1 Tax=Priestia sp. FSL R5-0597 TaxID=2921580 RepID=UPI0030FC67C3
MAQKFKKGQRVQITRGYVGNPVGEIVKYKKSFNAYNVKGDDGRNYDLLFEDQITPIIPREETVIEVNASKLPETPAYEKVTPDSAIEQLKLISALNQEITLSPAQAQKLVSEILELEKEEKRLQDGMKKIKMSVDFYSSEDVEEVK